MKETFKRNLENYNKVAKDEIFAEEMNVKDDRLEKVLDWHTEKAAKELGTEKQDQEKIYKLQVKKQEIMDDLKKSIALLDHPENQKEDISPLPKIVQSETGDFIRTTDSKQEKITLGEIMTDSEWGMEYNLDSSSISRNIRKKYLIEEAKRKLQDYLDDQIIINESVSTNVHWMKQDTYKRVAGEKERGEIKKAGLIAEKMVRNFIKKLDYDKGIGLKILKSDVYQDVNQKIDFIIHRENRDRGVRVEENKGDVGIQFTINTDKKIVKHKEKQVGIAKSEMAPEDKISDIVLVSMPLFDLKKKYDEWAEKKFPGGPDKLWTEEEKRTIFAGIMNGFMHEDEIKEYLDKIA
ncbi:MAG: hypothetical protein UT05_C0006G0045 [Parcubacteria group bacterium GW2011_GWF2_38_76]|nr:MAG: hypothetical protein UT05_C0006G0045 [Parcubacteria group bacterium GW2011_GWF2_38_76]HBM45856.1 hypothetical protein [Patescibacteria group bacterium]